MTYRMETKIPFDATEKDIATTVQKWNGRHLDISTIAHPRRYAAQKNLVQGKETPWTPETRAVTVSFTHHSGKRLSFTENRHGRPADNIRVLYLCIEDMRMNEVRGFNTIIQDAFLQLASGEDDWGKVLGVPKGTHPDIIKRAYQAKAKEAHPDTGGDVHAFARVQRAYEQAKKDRGF